jgi:two-component system OmpR family response regulator
VWQATEFGYDAVVLDVLLPDVDGFEVCRRLRSEGCWAPVLMLTARDAVLDRVRGLDAGADDYLTKPFSFVELSARLRALIRRGARERPTLLKAGDLRLDPASRRAWRGESELELSPKEFALLELFLRHPGQVLTRTHILEHVWDFAYDGVSNVVDQYIAYLRRKIDRPHGVKHLETVRGAGYRLRVPLPPRSG